MLGAVIADLAAWTWEHNRDCFWERLVSPEAKLSGYGVLALEMWPMIHEGGIIYKNRLYPVIGKALKHSAIWCDIPEDWRIWGSDEYDKPIPFDLKIAMISSALIDSGFLSEERQRQLNWKSFFNGGKQEYYATNIMIILRRLREGATKKEALKDLPECIFNWYKTGTPHQWNDYMEYITFAWRCFYYSFDYTSAIHNAMKCTGNRHLAAFLTGAFAGAMYGSYYSMIKEKYGGNYKKIEFPKDFPDTYRNLMFKIREEEFKSRIFFPKNDALTNVELHKWTPIENPFENYKINSELRRRLLLSYSTGWEFRFGTYLDNGWFYLYRSHYIFFRFKLKQIESSSWRITDLQKSDCEFGEIEWLKSYFQTLETFWYVNSRYSPYTAGQEVGPEALKYCRYYAGETQCPEDLKNTVNEKFWYGEMMFCEGNHNLNEWMKTAEEIYNNLPKEKKAFADKYSKETFAIIIYIETLFSKWCPYDSLDWIYEY